LWLSEIAIAPYKLEKMIVDAIRIYQNEIRQKIEAGNHGKIVATDINAY